MFRVSGIQTTCFWPQHCNLLQKEVISVSQSLVFLTTAVSCLLCLPVVLLTECACKGWAEPRAGEAFESQPGRNLKTKGLQTDIICNSGLSSCWGWGRIIKSAPSFKLQRRTCLVWLRVGEMEAAPGLCAFIPPPSSSPSQGLLIRSPQWSPLCEQPRNLAWQLVVRLPCEREQTLWDFVYSSPGSLSE